MRYTLFSLRQAITLDQLQRFGHVQAVEITNQIERIWTLEPALAVDIYDAIFGYVETDKTPVALDNSLIMALTAEKKQEYGMAYHLLTWKFGAFMSQLPCEATQVMIRVMRHYRDQEHPPISEAPIKIFRLNGRDCCFQSAVAPFGTIMTTTSSKKYHVLGKATLCRFRHKRMPPRNGESVCEVLVEENELVAVWRRLLLAAGRESAFYALRLWTVLREAVILGEDDTEEAASECIRSFAPHLTNMDLAEIGAAAIALRREDLPYIDDDYANQRRAYLKIKFLLAIPEERRSQAATDFLSACDPELLKRFQRRSAEDEAYLEAAVREQFGVANRARTGAGPEEKELLEASAPLMLQRSRTRCLSINTMDTKPVWNSVPYGTAFLVNGDSLALAKVFRQKVSVLVRWGASDNGLASGYLYLVVHP